MSKKLVFRIVVLGILLSPCGCKPEADRIRDDQAAEAARAAAMKEPAMPDQVAKAGVGFQGNSLDDIQGEDPRKLIAGPAQAYFQTKEKIVFEIQLPHTLNAFKALNGRNPNSHEEYMKAIEGIKLPKLPKNMIYRYHPETDELWVEAEKKD